MPAHTLPLRPPLHPARPRCAAVIMAAVVCVPFLLWFYRKDLMGPVQQYDKVLEEVSTYRITNWPLFSKCGACVRRGVCWGRGTVTVMLLGRALAAGSRRQGRRGGVRQRWVFSC